MMVNKDKEFLEDVMNLIKRAHERGVHLRISGVLPEEGDHYCAATSAEALIDEVDEDE